MQISSWSTFGAEEWIQASSLLFFLSQKAENEFMFLGVFCSIEASNNL